MKNILVIFSVILFTISCSQKEQIPSGLILKDPVIVMGCDTTYIIDTLIDTIPAAQGKHILIEEATGVLCANCPAGANVIKAIKLAHPDTVLSVSIYSPFLNQFQPPAKKDFNTQDALDLVFFIEGTDPSKPKAAIDRTFTGVVLLPYFYSPVDWASKVSSLLSKPTPLNIELSVNAGSTSNEYIVKSIITFTDTITSDLALSLYLLEDDVIDMQLDGTIKVLDYEHNHVLRKVITPIPGAAFLSTIPTKEKGRVVKRCHTFILPSNVLNKANCKILGFVHKTGSSKEVIHAMEIDL